MWALAPIEGGRELGTGDLALTHLTHCMSVRSDSDQAPDRICAGVGGGRAGGSEGVLGRGAESMVAEGARVGGGRRSAGEDGDTVNERELQDWLGAKSPTWLPGTNMGLHLRWEYRVQ